MLEHFAAVRRQARGVGASDRLEHQGRDEDQRPRRSEEGLRPAQKDPGTDVISIPLSVQPQSALLHVTGAEGGLVMSPLTSVSNTHPPASAPDELPPDELLEEPLDELLLDEPLDELLDELPPEELLDDPPDELPEDPLEELPPEELLDESGEESVEPPSVGFVGLLSSPHPVAMRLAAAAAMNVGKRANAPRVADLMCRSRSRPGWAF